MSYRRLARFNKKAPTQVKAPYVIFNPHDGEFPLPSPPAAAAFYGRPDETYIQIMAIDPGIKNCGVRIERRWSSGYVETVMLARINFLVSEDMTPGDTIYYTNSIKILRNYLPIMELCQYIIIESQLPINYDMVRMSTHIISFLMMNLENKGCKPMICEVDAYFKSRILQAPSKMSKPELKKWCREYALNLLQNRGDTQAHDMMIKAGKQDDMGDVVCYCEGWWKALQEGVQTIKMPLGGIDKTFGDHKVELLEIEKPVLNKRPKSAPEPKTTKKSKAKKEEIIQEPSLPRAIKGTKKIPELTPIMFK